MQTSEPSHINITKNVPLDMERWRILVAEWDASNENQKNYCRRLGLNLNTFTYVRGKILQKDNTKPKFIPVTLSRPEEQKIQSSDSLTLENRQGLKLHFSPSLSLEQLSKIFKLCGWIND